MAALDPPGSPPWFTVLLHPALFQIAQHVRLGETDGTAYFPISDLVLQIIDFGAA